MSFLLIQYFYAILFFAQKFNIKWSVICLLLMRTIIFLFAGIFMLFALLFESIRFNKLTGKLLPLIFIFFIIPLVNGVALNYENDVFSNTPILEEEKDFFDFHVSMFVNAVM